MNEWVFKALTPDTSDVLAAYLNYLNPEYGNPEAQKAWEMTAKEEFDDWLAEVTLTAHAEGFNQGWTEGFLEGKADR